ncbi:MAG TPA: hypothetical protein VND64_16905 [Pirellulales bacterium]|nr:hypothetical protein [Pirellulales bacterium]
MSAEHDSDRGLVPEAPQHQEEDLIDMTAMVDMTVRAHGECHHGALVMVLDAGTDAGIKDVRLFTDDDSES